MVGGAIRLKRNLQRNVVLRNRLRVARAELDISQEHLARLAGVTRQTIGYIEAGQYSPSTKLALILARVLGKQVDELFYLDGDGEDGHDAPSDR